MASVFNLASNKFAVWSKMNQRFAVWSGDALQGFLYKAVMRGYSCMPDFIREWEECQRRQLHENMISYQTVTGLQVKSIDMYILKNLLCIQEVLQRVLAQKCCTVL